ELWFRLAARRGARGDEPPRQLRKVFFKNEPLHGAAWRQQGAQKSNLLDILLKKRFQFVEPEPQFRRGSDAVECRFESLRDEIDGLLIRVANAECLERFQVANVVVFDLG